MSTGSIIAIAVIVFVVLAAIVVFTTAGRRDRDAATGGLSRETRRKDRSDLAPDAVPATVGSRASGREVEQAARLERTGTAIVPAAPAAAPAPYIPPDPETLGVTRRQFLNRGIFNMFAIGLGAFGAACLAFLWPGKAGGFGAKITLPAKLSEILDYYNTNREPYYYAPGRVYMNPYPKAAVSKAKKVSAYSPAVLAGMDAGVVALYQKCVHLGCRVPWCKTSQWFECPCHGSKYNRVGEKKGGPAPRGLDRFPVDVTDGQVTINTGIVVQGPPIGTNTTGQEAEGPNCV
jgi:cytochrome b6-f complex iron-sulfur subunit